MMKNIIVLLISVGLLLLGFSSLKAAPSDEYLKSEKQSIGQMSSLNKAAPVSVSKVSVFSSEWDTPGGGSGSSGTGEPGDTGNERAPLGDATPAVLISLLLIYLIYRGVNVSKRRSKL